MHTTLHRSSGIPRCDPKEPSTWPLFALACEEALRTHPDSRSLSSSKSPTYPVQARPLRNRCHPISSIPVSTDDSPYYFASLTSNKTKRSQSRWTCSRLGRKPNDRISHCSNLGHCSTNPHLPDVRIYAPRVVYTKKCPCPFS